MVHDDLKEGGRRSPPLSLRFAKLNIAEKGVLIFIGKQVKTRFESRLRFRFQSVKTLPITGNEMLEVALKQSFKKLRCACLHGSRIVVGRNKAVESRIERLKL